MPDKVTRGDPDHGYTEIERSQMQRMRALVSAGSARCSRRQVAAGCGSTTTAQRRKRRPRPDRARNADRRDRHRPIRRSRQGKPPDYSGFDIEVMNAVADEARPRAEVHRHPVRDDLRRPAGREVRRRRRGDDDHAGSRASASTSRIPTIDADQSLLVQRAATSRPSTTSRRQDGRRPARARPVSYTRRRTPTRPSIRYPEGPTRSTR